MRVFVTGGAGYIGSHTLLQLLRADHDVMVYDNFSNSTPEALARVKQLSNADFTTIEGDIQDEYALEGALEQFRPDAVIHFAGLKAVGESTEKPLEYYAQNVFGSIALLRAMDKVDCQKIVFSSSATVYGEAQYLPFDESHPLGPTNPYGRTKYFIEDIIRDWAKSRPQSSAAILRYFNPVGADGSSRIGEDPNEVPNNLLPFIAQVAIGRLPELNVFGADYGTRDGTGERDYIHVEDLARAHQKALTFLQAQTGCEVFNIGTGKGVTVLEMIKAFENTCGRPVPYRVQDRRTGDVAISLAAADKAHRLLDWRARHGLDAMCASTWAWQSANPDGYQSD